MYTMKKTIIAALAALVSLASCSDFFDSESGSDIKADGQVYNSELDARSGLFGLLQGLQQVGDNYVLMGELRADLMTTTDNAPQELRDICEWQADSANSYLRLRQWYSLVNNCNYYIAHLDTAVTHLEEGLSVKFLQPYMAQAKAIRAWAYLNLCLDYGHVSYTTKPLLDASEQPQADKLTLDKLLPLLEADLLEAASLLPVADANDTWAQGYTDPGFSSSVSFDGIKAQQLLFPLRFLLGEIYLWQGQYEKAAQAYYDLIYADQLKSTAWTNRYDATGTTVTQRNWPNLFTGFAYADILTAIVFGGDGKSQLATMAGSDYTIAPSTTLMSLFDAQEYYANRSVSGDLRGLYGTYRLTTATDGDAQEARITKYGNMKTGDNAYVAPVRSALVWLRYAEAVNRLGKPKLAFYGFLKYGLSAYNVNLYRDKDALRGEVTGEAWMNFGQDDLEGEVAKVFASNTRGFHARGCGNTDMNETYQIEEQPTLADSILWVEERLVDEYALETSLEGNRFHDLMRVALRRSDPAWLADKVASKFTGARQTKVKARLSQPENWYLPE